MSEINVLLIDDDSDFLVTIAGRLVDCGLNVLSAAGGDEALEIVKRIGIDVVVLDILMPYKDGLQTLLEIKKSYLEIEIIMLTGFADVDTVVKCMHLGAFDYLIKPIQIDKLHLRILDAYKMKLLKTNSKKP